MPTKPTCRKCGAVCEWGDVDGQWRLFEGGVQHRCGQPALVSVQKPAYLEPQIERTDTEMLARQVARLATAVEMLTEELRERRAIRS